jgi:DNA-binding MarR family transcriptional regulator
MTTLEAITAARKMGITPSCLHVLLAVLDDSPLTPSVVAERCGISTAAVTQLTDVLAKGDWIDRQPFPNDRRKAYIVPTERAFNLFLPILEAETIATP